MDSYMSDEELTSSTETLEDNPIDTFFQENMDNIIDIYEDFKERFAYNPEFFQYLTSCDLTDFSIQCIFGKKNTFFELLTVPHNFITVEVMNAFKNLYSQELDISFYIMYGFLKQNKYRLSKDLWIRFCFLHTQIEK